MSDSIRIVTITDDHGLIVEPHALARSEPVHRQLRAQLEPDYRSHIQRIFQDGGRMCVAERDGTTVGVAVYRVYENTVDGLHMYVDDLVTDEKARSTGVGKALLDHLIALARRSSCKTFILDSGMQRQRAHAFYLREGLSIRGYHFAKRLD